MLSLHWPHFVGFQQVALLNLAQVWVGRHIGEQGLYVCSEDKFDMSNVGNFKEIEKKKWGMLILCYVFGQLSSVKRLA